MEVCMHMCVDVRTSTKYRDVWQNNPHDFEEIGGMCGIRNIANGSVIVSFSGVNQVEYCPYQWTYRYHVTDAHAASPNVVLLIPLA